VCNDCGGEDITEDATVTWDAVEQTWIVVDLRDYSWCSDCDHEVIAKFMVINNLKHKAIMAIRKEERDGV
jgi:hypothetical protein